MFNTHVDSSLSVVTLMAERPGFNSRYGYFSWPLLRDGPSDKGLFPPPLGKAYGAEADHISLSIVEIRFLGTALPHSCIRFHGVALNATGKSQCETDDRRTG